MRLCLSDVIAEANALREIDIGTIATMPNDTLLRQHEGIRRASQLHLSIRDRYGPENGTHLWCTVHARFLWLQRTRRVAIPRSLDASRVTPIANARRDLFEAMKQIAETGHGPKDQLPSMGCSIKWKH